jgi:hypothetical protein
MKYAIPIISIILFIGNAAHAQHQEIGEQPAIWKESKKESLDTNSFLYAFKKGQASGHLRYFFMATDNEKELSDYYANAAGGGLKFETAKFKGFQMGISGFFTFNIGSSNFLIPDKNTGQFNRYEIGLFDQEDPSNKKDIDRLEELYVKYSSPRLSITAGKQLINTPFINLQDGRMRPTEVNGLLIYHKKNKTNIEGGILYQISPRGTVKWYSIGESIGIYSTGINKDGTKSEYENNTSSKGILIFGISKQPNKYFSVKLWNIYAENIFNTSFLQGEYKSKPINGHTLIAGIQLLQQNRSGEGGNKELVKKYMQDKSSLAFGGKFGWDYEKWTASLNYNRITSKGRYTMPREWGRDPFYTFMPRERNEGFADVHAYVFKIGTTFPKQRINLNFAAGHFDMPSVDNYAANKYGLPSYNQFNIDARYTFTGLLSGLETQLLFAYKAKAVGGAVPQKFIINKVNMGLWNLVMNYNF